MLELDGLVKRFGSTTALDGLSFSVRRGEMFGFVGQNGAGKTTAMRIVLGVLAADGGEVRWDGRVVDAALRRRIGYMPEERGLYPKMRVRDHLAYLARLHGAAPAAARREADHWLEALGLEGRAGDRVESLSLGNQQRVQLAAALVHAPDVLVLDEPFSGLDPVGVDVLADALRSRVTAGVPVVFSSHQLDLVERLCDSVGIIKAGRLVAGGTVADLRGASRPARIRLRVDAPGGPGGGTWLAEVPGVTVLADDGGAVLVELGGRAGDADDQALLAAALSAGEVREFTPVHPTLTDLFREAVAA